MHNRSKEFSSGRELMRDFIRENVKSTENSSKPKAIDFEYI